MHKGCSIAMAALITVLLAEPAYATIDGFILEAINEVTDGFSLDDRIGGSRGETEHVINIEDCLEYQGQTIEIVWGLEFVPSTDDEYAVKLAEPGGSCPTDDLDDPGETTGTCQGILVYSETPSDTNNKFEVDLDDITGGDCNAGTDEVTRVYVVYDDALLDQIDDEAIEFQVDLEPPVAPVSVGAESGETSINVTWEDDANTEDDISYRVYYRKDEPVYTTDVADGSSTTGADARSLRVSGLETDSVYFFRVAAVDKNDNEGPLSSAYDVFAVTVPVSDFWETYKGAGGGEPGGFGCSTTSTAGPSFDVALLLLAAAAFVAWRRRRALAPAPFADGGEARS